MTPNTHRWRYELREGLSYRPVFLQNFCDLWYLAGAEEQPSADRIRLLGYFAPIALRWLDRTKVSADRDAQRSAKVLLRLVSKLADWSKLEGDLGGLRDIVQLHKRLSGLVGGAWTNEDSCREAKTVRRIRLP